MPCDQRLQSGRFSGEEYSPIVCRAPECAFCPSFAEINAEISKTHLILAELSRKRGELKAQIICHHKPYINRLPFELISQIFIDIVQEYRAVHLLDHCWFEDFDIPLRLGAVCKMWREVTLAIPQLWTTVKFRVNFCPCQIPHKIDVAKEWFRRSNSLPLSIRIYPRESTRHCESMTCRSNPSKNYDFDSLVDLLRSHSPRWSRIYIESNMNQPQLHKLLENLPNQPTDLEYLSLSSCRPGPGTFDKTHVLLPRSIYQYESLFDSVGLWDIPCSFECLTHMEMERVPIDELFYFFQNAPNLQYCTITLDNIIDLENVDESFPLPTTPIVAQHLTYLATGPSAHETYLGHPILPSLQTLLFESYAISSQDDLNDLLVCLEQSRPPLQTFYLKVYLNSPDFDDWYKLLPEITSLSINMSEIRYQPESPTQCTVTENFLAALARPSGTLALPKLQSLHLTTRGMSDASWASLCDIFTTGSPDRLKLLKKIEIHPGTSKCPRNFTMEAKVFEVFDGLKNAGVRLKVVYYLGPKFGSSASTPL